MRTSPCAAIGCPGSTIPASLEAAQARVEASWSPHSEPWRLDLRDRYTLTIDSARTQDIDDALSLRSLESGGYEIGIHIADPDAFVPPWFAPRPGGSPAGHLRLPAHRHRGHVPPPR